MYDLSPNTSCLFITLFDQFLRSIFKDILENADNFDNNFRLSLFEN